MTIAVLVLLLIAVIGSGAMAAVLGTMWGRIQRMESGGARPQALPGAHDQTEALREQMLALEDEVTRLNERVDFTEKLLEAPRGPTPDSDLPG